ncbi:MAG: hypothetical protein WA830_00320 [Candidatus Sulfotelmatobacter sp.]
MRIAAILLIVTWMTTLSLSAQRIDEAGTAAAIRALEREWVEGQSRNVIVL